MTNMLSLRKFALAFGAVTSLGLSGGGALAGHHFDGGHFQSPSSFDVKGETGKSDFNWSDKGNLDTGGMNRGDMNRGDMGKVADIDGKGGKWSSGDGKARTFTIRRHEHGHLVVITVVKINGKFRVVETQRSGTDKIGGSKTISYDLAKNVAAN